MQASTEIDHVAHRHTGIFARGGDEPFAQKILSSCPNFYGTVERKRGSYDGLHMKRKYFLGMNLSYEPKKHFKT